MSTPPCYRFSHRFEVLPLERMLLADGRRASVGSRAFDLLLALIEHRGRHLTRDELLDLVWPETAVEPNNLAVQVSTLRKLLGPDAIATIPGRGYRFAVALDETPALGAVAPANTPAPAQSSPTTSAFKTNLPETFEALVGRDEALAALEALVDRHALVTITGAGGIGKSRLAQQLLHLRRGAWRHGVCWVDLTSLTEAATLPGVLAAALGIALGAGEPSAALRTALAPLQMLVALDNAEHLLEGVASLATSLCDAAPGLRLVVTSQAPLRVAREQVYRLAALAVPPGPMPALQALGHGAVQLFVERARAADARFVFDDRNVAAIIDLCRRLDGLALAIELAAARAPVLGVQRIIESLDERLNLLKGGLRHAPPRHRTLRAALDWSHGLLGAHERAVFRRLAVIAGSATLEVIQRIAADDDDTAGAAADGPLDRWDVVDVLSNLIDRSFVVLSPEASDPERPRYRLLDSPRAYAQERLHEAGEAELMAERHAHAVGHLMAAAWETRWSGRIGVGAWKAGVQPDRDNARTALAWAIARNHLPLVLMMAPVLLFRGVAEGPETERLALAEALDRLLANEPVARSHLLTRTALTLFWFRRQPRRGLAEAPRVIALAREMGNRFVLYLLWSTVSHNAARIGDRELTASSLAEMHAVEDPAWPPSRLYWGAEAEAICVGLGVEEGSAAACLPLWHRAIELARAAGDDVSRVGANLADAQLAANEVEAAVASGRALVSSLQQTREDGVLVYARLNLVGALLRQDDIASARLVAEAGWPLAIDFDLRAYYADYLGLLAALEGRYAAAVRLAGYATAAYRRKDMPRWPNEAQAAERSAALARSALDAVEIERLAAEGALLRDAQIAGLAFGSAIGD